MNINMTDVARSLMVRVLADSFQDEVGVLVEPNQVAGKPLTPAASHKRSQAKSKRAAAKRRNVRARGKK